MDLSHRIRLNQIALRLELVCADLEILSSDVARNDDPTSERMDIETGGLHTMIQTFKYLAEGGELSRVPF